MIDTFEEHRVKSHEVSDMAGCPAMKHLHRELLLNSFQISSHFFNFGGRKDIVNDRKSVDF